MADGKFPERGVLEGVARIGYGVRLCPLPGSVEAMLKYMDQPVDYNWLMGVSGACFRRVWNRDDGGNVDLGYFSPEPQRRVFEALGFELTTLTWKDKAALVDAIRKSIAAGRPAIVYGVVGPPEAGLVCGYDKDGEVLIGQSYFQDRGEFPDYYEKPGWYEQEVNKAPGPDGDLGATGERPALTVLGQRKARPAGRDVMIGAIRWAVDLARTAKRPNLPRHVCGLAACDAWADGLEIDADYPDDDPTVQRTRGMIYGDQIVMLVEREHAAAFLRQAAALLPETGDELRRAADLYARVGKMPDMWPWKSHFPMSEEVKQGLCDAALRRKLATQVRKARDLEAQAVEQLEKALKRIDAGVAD